MNVTCSRRGCSDSAVCFTGKQQYGYCARHQSIINRRSNARTAGKLVPSWEWFESKMNETGMHCELCGKKMQLMAKGKSGSRRDVYSLQHNPNGECALVCVSCNGRLGAIDESPRIQPKGNHKPLLRVRHRMPEWINLLNEKAPDNSVHAEVPCTRCGEYSLMEVAGTMKWCSSGMFAMSDSDVAWIPSQIMCPHCNASWELDKTNNNKE